MENKWFTLIGQIILFCYTVTLAFDVVTGGATIPAYTSGGFIFALLCISLGNLDRDTIAIPSLFSMVAWCIILGATI